MIRKYFLSLILLTFTLGGCASRMAKPWLAQNLLGDQGAMVLWTKLDDQGELKGRYSCTLILASQAGQEVRLPVKAGESRHIIVADPGTYSYRALECGMFTDFGLEVAPRFAIVPGHFSWVGHLDLTLNDRKNLKWGFTSDDTNKTKLDYLALPTEVRAGLMTGYSATKMTAEFFENPKDNIRVEAHNLGKPLDPNVVTFQGCFDTEEDINPLKIGNLTFSKNGYGAFEKSGAHTYTAVLVKCIEEGLASLDKSYFTSDSKISITY